MGLVFALLILGGFYTYFVITSIAHVAARQELVGKVASLKSSVSELESKYLSKTSGITESYAHSLGYVTAKNETFVQRNIAVTLHDAQ